MHRSRRRYYYYPYFYPNYHPSGKGFLAVSGGENMKEETIKAIASIIVDNREELIKELDELKIACSCGLHDATEADLADIIVENIGDEKLRAWIAQRTASKFGKLNAEGGGGSGGGGGGAGAGSWLSAITEVFKTVGVLVHGGQQNKAIKGEYKNLITQKALEYKAEQEKAKRAQRTTDTIIIVGASLAFIGFGALLYISSTKQQSRQLAIAK
jgi:hypothetical protein